MLDNLGELVVKPANESGGYGLLIGNRATAGRARRRGRPRSRPTRATGSPSRSSTCRPRRRCATTASSPATSTCARSSSPARTSYVTAGGLTRVALREGLARRQLVAGRRQQGHLDRRVRSPPGRAARTARAIVMLLSRVAESLYWAARYLERAEDTARIVREHSEVIVDLPDVRVDLVGAAARDHRQPGGLRRAARPADEESIVRFLVADASNPGSVVVVRRPGAGEPALDAGGPASRRVAGRQRHVPVSPSRTATTASAAAAGAAFLDRIDRRRRSASTASSRRP